MISLKSMESAESIAKEITSKLEQDNLDLNDCRGQTYDNAATMSGKVSGVQKLISQKNPKAKFVNCDNHSLNLVGVHAASEHAFAISFFGVLDSLYNFFLQLNNAMGEIEGGSRGGCKAIL